MRDAVLFVTRRPPLPLDNGARIRAHRLLTGLGSAFDTTLLTFEHHPASEDGCIRQSELQSMLPGIEVVSAPGLGRGKRGRQLLSLASTRSSAFGRYRRPALAAALRACAARRPISLVHFDDLGVAGFAPLAGPANVYAPHNIEHRVPRDLASRAVGARRVFSAVEWRKILREEQRVWRNVDLCVAVSGVDAEAIRSGGARRVVLCPNGTDPVDRLAPPRRLSSEPLRLLFVGSGRYQPYERGLSWFLTEVFPVVRQAVPVALDIIGQPPRRPVRHTDVEYHGRVPSVAPWYERCHAVVVPVFEGSGTRLKVVEAMAYGRPLVSTPLGAEGIPVTAGRDYWAAEDAEQFVQALLVVAEHCERRVDDLEVQLRNARAAVTSLFWPNIIEELVTVYREEIERWRVSRSSAP